MQIICNDIKLIESSIERFFQFSGLFQLFYYVESADQIALGVDLRIRRPIGVNFKRLSHFFIHQDVERLVFDVEFVQNGDQSSTEATSRRLWTALHEHHYRRSIDKSFEPILNIVGTGFGRNVIGCYLRGQCLDFRGQLRDVCALDSTQLFAPLEEYTGRHSSHF